MKENYSKLCEEIINNLDYTPSLLLHSCCGPCSSYVIEFLSDYFNITVLYYNPNISPIDEYEKRKQEQLRLITELKTKNKVNFLDCDYDNNLYEETIKGLENEKEGGARCLKCFTLRLKKTALVASLNNFDYFTTTLSVSPYKNSQVLNEIGLKLQAKYHIKWLYSDFKKKDGYKKSILLSKKYNLYRQNYCGCIYSKKESMTNNIS